MNICPHCNGPGISTFRKLSTGPAISTRCRACGKKVSVPAYSVLTAVPFIIAIMLAFYVDIILLKGILWMTGILIMAIIQLKWVPLVPR